MTTHKAVKDAQLSKLLKRAGAKRGVTDDEIHAFIRWLDSRASKYREHKEAGSNEGLRRQLQRDLRAIKCARRAIAHYACPERRPVFPYFSADENQIARFEDLSATFITTMDDARDPITRAEDAIRAALDCMPKRGRGQPRADDRKFHKSILLKYVQLTGHVPSRAALAPFEQVLAIARERAGFEAGDLRRVIKSVIG